MSKVQTCLDRHDKGRSDPIQNFDTLPDSSHVRVGVVSDLLACSKSTVWRLAKAGKIPRPVRLSENITGWRVGDIRAHLESLSGVER